MKDGKIQVYEPGKKPNRFKVSTKDHPLIDEMGAAEELFKSDLSGESALQNYLHSNPFLYNPELNPLIVYSIEDFIVHYKYEKYALGDVIRNPKFTIRQRKKIVKRSFGDWKKEYNLKKNKAFKENDKVIEVIGDVTYIEYTFIQKILLLLVFIGLLFLVVTDSLIWSWIKTGGFGYNIYQTIYNMYIDMPWLKIVGNVGIYLSLLLIFFSIIYTIIIKDFRKNYALAQSFLTNSESSISRDFNKKYKKARRYYLKRVDNVKHPYFPPLEMEEVQEGKMNITIFKDICDSIIDRAYKIKKMKPYIVFLKKIIEYSTYASAITVLALSLYSMVLKIFN